MENRPQMSLSERILNKMPNFVLSVYNFYLQELSSRARTQEELNKLKVRRDRVDAILANRTFEQMPP